MSAWAEERRLESLQSKNTRTLLGTSTVQVSSALKPLPTFSNSIAEQIKKQESIEKEIAILDKWLDILKKAELNPRVVLGINYYNITGVDISNTPFSFVSLTTAPKFALDGLRGFYLSRKNSLNSQLVKLQNAPSTDSGGGGNGASGLPSSPTVKLSSSIIYNAPAVKDAYFRGNQSFFNDENKIDNYIFAGNAPGAKVNDANELWQKVQAIDNENSSKGMIQTWNNPASTLAFLNDGGLSPIGGSNSSGQIQRYGFQFIYNPTSINMSYGGVADVDPGWAASGADPFILSNPTVFQSSINFSILVNRMYDMNYLGPGGSLKNGTINELYQGNRPTASDLKKIYNKGTMYDVEFLLQTMFPYDFVKTQLRGSTSDIGFLGPMPVELHLGKSLRYLTQINSIQVNHIIFDNRMVPLYTVLMISANRIPDASSGLLPGTVD
jgi:hypothetical protein